MRRSGDSLLALRPSEERTENTLPAVRPSSTAWPHGSNPPIISRNDPRPIVAKKYQTTRQPMGELGRAFGRSITKDTPMTAKVIAVCITGQETAEKGASEEDTI